MTAEAHLKRLKEASLAADEYTVGEVIEATRRLFANLRKDMDARISALERRVKELEAQTQGNRQVRQLKPRINGVKNDTSNEIPSA